MSNSAVLFVPAARCCTRVVGLFACAFASASAGEPTGLRPAAVATAAIPSPRTRGGWSADRRTLSFGRACAARPPCPGATGTPLGAPPWRFSDADPRSRLPAVEPEPPATARAKPSGLAVGVRTSLRCGSRRVRGTPLLAPSFRIVSRKRPSEPGCASYISTSICSQDINSYRSRQSTGGGGGLHVVSK